MGEKKNPLHMITFILLAIGGLNWLVFGLAETELGTWIGGMDSIQAKVIYILVGLAALYELIMHKSFCKLCGGGKMASAGSGGQGSGGGTGGGQM